MRSASRPDPFLHLLIKQERAKPMSLKAHPRQQRAASRRAPVRPEADRKAQQDALLDQALKETFPASDPVSVFQVQ